MRSWIWDVLNTAINRIKLHYLKLTKNYEGLVEKYEKIKAQNNNNNNEKNENEPVIRRKITAPKAEKYDDDNDNGDNVDDDDVEEMSFDENLEKKVCFFI